MADLTCTHEEVLVTQRQLDLFATGQVAAAEPAVPSVPLDALPTTHEKAQAMMARLARAYLGTPYDFIARFPLPTPAARQELAEEAYPDPRDSVAVRIWHHELLRNLEALASESAAAKAQAATARQPFKAQAARARAEALALRREALLGEYAMIYGQECACALERFANIPDSVDYPGAFYTLPPLRFSVRLGRRIVRVRFTGFGVELRGVCVSPTGFTSLTGGAARPSQWRRAADSYALQQLARALVEQRWDEYRRTPFGSLRAAHGDSTRACELQLPAWAGGFLREDFLALTARPSPRNLATTAWYVPLPLGIARSLFTPILEQGSTGEVIADYAGAQIRLRERLAARGLQKVLAAGARASTRKVPPVAPNSRVPSSSGLPKRRDVSTP